jgi:hypothetical protein
LPPEEKRKITQPTEAMFDRWQAEQDAMSERNDILINIKHKQQAN